MVTERRDSGPCKGLFDARQTGDREPPHASQLSHKLSQS